MSADCLSPAAFRRRLTRAIVVPIALLGLLALVFLWQVLYLLTAARWVDHTDQVIGQGNELQKLFVDGETGVRGYLIANDPAFLEPYHAQEAEIDPAFDELIDLVSDNPPQVERLTSLRRAHAEWRAFARQLIDRRRDGGDYLTPVQAHEDKRRMDALRVRIAEFIGVEERLREVRVRTTQRATWLVGSGSVGLTLLLGAALAFLTRRQLVDVSASYRTAIATAEARSESLRRSAHRLETLHQIDHAILGSEPLPVLTRAALRRADEVVPSGDSFVLAADREGGLSQVYTRHDHSHAPDPADPTLGPSAVVGRDAPTSIPDLAAVAGRSPFHERLCRLGVRSLLTVPLRTEEQEFGALVFADPRPAAFGDDHALVAHEIARQIAIAIQQDHFRDRLRRHADELERRVEERTRELQEALRNVGQLQAMLPICAWCKKVRDDQNYWHNVEHYIAAHTATRFTHGMCPDCFRAKDEEFRRLGH